jgi:hypothetical protein
MKTNLGVNITYEEALDILLNVPKEKFTQFVYEGEPGYCCSLGHLCKILYGSAIPRRNICGVIDPYTGQVWGPSLSKISSMNDRAKVPKYGILNYLLKVVNDGKGDCLVFDLSL